MFARILRLSSIAALVVALTATSACDDNPVVVPPPPPSESPVLVSLEWQHPFPQGNDLNRMWGFSDRSFYAVGDAGAVLHHDGVDWTIVDTPARTDLHGIWASGTSDVYAAGFEGTLIHFDGSKWEFEPVPTQEDLYSVWAEGGSIFVAGTGGRVWERRPGTWIEHTVAPGRRFRALWGYAANDLYAFGSGGSIYHFDGTSWTKIIFTLNPNWNGEIRDAWGPAPGSFSFIADTGYAWFDGTVWRVGGAAGTAYGIWGFSLDALIVVAARGSAHWDGVNETRFDTPEEKPFFDVWGTSTSDCFAVGYNGDVAHFDGAGWQLLSAGVSNDLRDIWVDGSTAIAVGEGGIVLHGNGSAWSEELVGTGYDLAGVWATGGFLVAVGRYTPDQLNWRHAILTSNGAGWNDAGIVGTSYRLFDVWGASATDIYAVGWVGEILHYNGATWNVADAGSGDAAYLQSVSGTSPDNVIAVGRTNDLHGLVCRFDGMAWSKTEMANVEELCAVWVESPTNALAVGSFGAIRRYDGSSWSAMKSPTTEKLMCVWGTSATDVYAAGWAGALVHYDGTCWKRLLPATNRTITGISGRSSTDIYFSGDRGAIFFFDGLPSVTAYSSSGSSP